MKLPGRINYYFFKMSNFFYLFVDFCFLCCIFTFLIDKEPKIMKKQITLFLALLIATLLSANNIAVTNIKLTGQNTTSQYTMVQFDISWENSWRTSSAPNNWDAAWVFVKFKVGNGTWNHATLNLTGHTAPSGSTITTASDGTGAFIYHDADGTGPFAKTGVQLRWNYGANGVADNAVVDIQVFTIEMVYVPVGAFYVGTGGTGAGSFTDGSWISGATIPLLVTSENALTIAQTAGNLWGTSSSGTSTIGPPGTLDASFPKGYAAFYCMKYEISQQEYVDFLNSLTYAQQVTRTAIAPNSSAGTYLYNAYRNKIFISASGIATTTPAIYATDYPYVACNDLNWADLAAYIDWSGLRPMTELEFEKACRGTIAPVANEYAWGTTGIANNAYTLSNSGAYNEVIAANYSADGNAVYNLTTPLNGSINGPVRGGIFAGTSGNTGKVTAGATYYGIMEMSGNLRERPVSVGNLTGRAYTGAHGNGTLDATGNADALFWPGINAVGSGFRGGNWVNDFTRLRVSDRTAGSSTADNRSITYGGRGVRLAP